MASGKNSDFVESVSVKRRSGEPFSAQVIVTFRAAAAIKSAPERRGSLVRRSSSGPIQASGSSSHSMKSAPAALTTNKLEDPDDLTKPLHKCIPSKEHKPHPCPTLNKQTTELKTPGKGLAKTNLRKETTNTTTKPLAVFSTPIKTTQKRSTIPTFRSLPSVGSKPYKSNTSSITKLSKYSTTINDASLISPRTAVNTKSAMISNMPTGVALSTAANTRITTRAVRKQNRAASQRARSPRARSPKARSPRATSPRVNAARNPPPRSALRQPIRNLGPPMGVRLPEQRKQQGFFEKLCCPAPVPRPPPGVRPGSPNSAAPTARSRVAFTTRSPNVRNRTRAATTNDYTRGPTQGTMATRPRERRPARSPKPQRGNSLRTGARAQTSSVKSPNKTDAQSRATTSRPRSPQKKQTRARPSKETRTQQGNKISQLASRGQSRQKTSSPLKSKNVASSPRATTKSSPNSPTKARSPKTKQGATRQTTSRPRTTTTAKKSSVRDKKSTERPIAKNKTAQKGIPVTKQTAPRKQTQLQQTPRKTQKAKSATTVQKTKSDTKKQALKAEKKASKSSEGSGKPAISKRAPIRSFIWTTEKPSVQRRIYKPSSTKPLATQNVATNSFRESKTQIAPLNPRDMKTQNVPLNRSLTNISNTIAAGPKRREDTILISVRVINANSSLSVLSNITVSGDQTNIQFERGDVLRNNSNRKFSTSTASHAAWFNTMRSSSFYNRVVKAKRKALRRNHYRSVATLKPFSIRSGSELSANKFPFTHESDSQYSRYNRSKAILRFILDQLTKIEQKQHKQRITTEKSFKADCPHARHTGRTLTLTKNNMYPAETTNKRPKQTRSSGWPFMHSLLKENPESIIVAIVTGFTFIWITIAIASTSATSPMQTTSAINSYSWIERQILTTYKTCTSQKCSITSVNNLQYSNTTATCNDFYNFVCGDFYHTKGIKAALTSASADTKIQTHIEQLILQDMRLSSELSIDRQLYLKCKEARSAPGLSYSQLKSILATIGIYRWPNGNQIDRKTLWCRLHTKWKIDAFVTITEIVNKTAKITYPQSALYPIEELIVLFGQAVKEALYATHNSFKYLDPISKVASFVTLRSIDGVENMRFIRRDYLPSIYSDILNCIDKTNSIKHILIPNTQYFQKIVPHLFDETNNRIASDYMVFLLLVQLSPMIPGNLKSLRRLRSIYTFGSVLPSTGKSDVDCLRLAIESTPKCAYGRLLTTVGNTWMTGAQNILGRLKRFFSRSLQRVGWMKAEYSKHLHNVNLSLQLSPVNPSCFDVDNASSVYALYQQNILEKTEPASSILRLSKTEFYQNYSNINFQPSLLVPSRNMDSSRWQTLNMPRIAYKVFLSLIESLTASKNTGLITNATQKELQECLQNDLEIFRKVSSKATTKNPYKRHIRALVNSLTALHLATAFNKKNAFYNEFSTSNNNIHNSQLFFVVYVLHNCEQRTKLSEAAHMIKGTAPPWISVNFILRHMSEFRQAFHCMPNDNMVSDNPCLIMSPDNTY